MIDDQFLRGQAAERRRVSEILLSRDAQGRERLAIELAVNTGLSVDGAVRTLSEIAAIDAARGEPRTKRK